MSTLTIVVLVALVVGLIAHAVQWYRELGTSRLTRDLVLGRDQFQAERKQILDAAQTDQRQRLQAVVSIGDRRGTSQCYVSAADYQQHFTGRSNGADSRH